MLKKTIFAILIVVSSVVIIAAFFMPWVSAATSVSRVSTQATNSMKPLSGMPFMDKFMTDVKLGTAVVKSAGDIDIRTAVTGYDIPKMVNSGSSKVAISFARRFFKDAEGLDKKSMLVYLLPLLAILCIILTIAGMRYKLAIAFMLILSGAISLGGLYNLNTLNLSNDTVDIAILKGLWYTMYGYLAIFIISTMWIASDIIGKYIKEKGPK